MSTTVFTTTAELGSRVRFAWTMACRGLLSAATEQEDDSDPRCGTLDESLREVYPVHQYPRACTHPLGLVRCLGQRWNPPDLKYHPCGETNACGELCDATDFPVSWAFLNEVSKNRWQLRIRARPGDHPHGNFRKRITLTRCWRTIHVLDKSPEHSKYPMGLAKYSLIPNGKSLFTEYSLITNGKNL
jgi:hypothetical protein